MMQPAFLVTEARRLALPVPLSPEPNVWRSQRVWPEAELSIAGDRAWRTTRRRSEFSAQLNFHRETV